MGPGIVKNTLKNKNMEGQFQNLLQNSSNQDSVITGISVDINE